MFRLQRLQSALPVEGNDVAASQLLSHLIPLHLKGLFKCVSDLIRRDTLLPNAADRVFPKGRITSMTVASSIVVT